MLSFPEFERLVRSGAPVDDIIAAVQPLFEKYVRENEQTRQRMRRLRERSRNRSRNALREHEKPKQINGHVTVTNGATLSSSSFFLNTDRPPKKRESSIANKNQKTFLPDDWKPKPSHFDLAKRKHLWGISDVLAKEEWFRDQALAKGWRYCDWDRAFNNCIRDKWGVR